MDLDAEVKTIRSAPIFRGLDANKMRLLACISEQLRFDPGEYVCERGENSDAAYVILDGEIEFVAHSPKGETVLGRQGPGTIFGEVSLLCEQKRSACVRAVSPLSVMRINKDCFLRMMQDNAQFSMAVAQELARRVVRLAEKVGTEMAH
jgi:CRP-like cAMP-binding protein